MADEITPIYSFIHKDNRLVIFYKKPKIEVENNKVREPAILLGITKGDSKRYIQLDVKEANLLVAILSGLIDKGIKDTVMVWSKYRELQRERKQGAEKDDFPLP